MKSTNQDMNPLRDVVPEDAIGMLVADHKRVAALFAQFRRVAAEGREQEKRPIVETICRELTIHTQLEEELFYPAVRKATKEDDQLNEAVVEHAGAKQLIAQLEGADPAEDLYDARVTVLGEQIDHHVEEEEGSLFPKARYSGLDTMALGAAMIARKSQLLSGAAKPPAPPALASGESKGPRKTAAASRIRSTSTIRKKKPSAKARSARGH